MRKMLILWTLSLLAGIFTQGAAPKSENLFKPLSKDEPTNEAIILYTIRIENSTRPIAGGEVFFSSDAIVYSCPMKWFNSKRDPDTKMYVGEITYYFKTSPGDFDLTMITVNSTNGNYNTSTDFPLSGKFSLEPGTVNYIATIKVDLSKPGCTIFQGEPNYSQASSQFKKDYPNITNAIDGKISTISFTPTVPLKSGESIVADDFSQFGTPWQISEGPLHKTGVTEGQLQLDNQGTDSSVVLRNLALPETFDVEVACRWISGETNKGYGLIIGNDPVTCLKFSITPNGYCSIFRWLPKKDLKWISQSVVGWKKTDAIHTGAGEENVLRVQKTSWFMHTVGFISFYINDNLVARDIYFIFPSAGGSGTQFNKEGVIGFYSYGKQVIAWDNFRVSAL